jgi:hypothetical protein
MRLSQQLLVVLCLEARKLLGMVLTVGPKGVAGRNLQCLPSYIHVLPFCFKEITWVLSLLWGVTVCCLKIMDCCAPKAGFLVDLGGVWDALVIDDYYCLSAEKINAPVAETVAHGALDTARQAYSIEGLLGSAEKDVDACTSLKAAGAEIRSGEKKARSGVVPVGAPFGKRIALAAALPGITAALISRLAGNWVSVLQYRKCFSTLINFMFKLSSRCMEEAEIHHLPRSVAQELTLLACMSPLIFSNIAVDMLDSVFATDASNQKGAVVAAEIDPGLPA